MWDKEPDDISEELGWVSGRVDSEVVGPEETGMTVSKPTMTRGVLREWAIATHNETTSMRYVLESTDRGHCTKNAECQCFPPYRGPLCEYEDPARPREDLSKPYRAVIHYLTSNDDGDVRDMTRSLSRIWERYNVLHDYPVVIFHDGLTEGNRRIMVEASHNRLWFHFIDEFKDLPASVSNDAAHMHGLSNIKWSIGYRANCRFHSGPVFQQPVMKHFDYSMHLDSDSYFPGDVLVDPLREFHDGNYTYAFSHLLLDHPVVLRHFWSTSLTYMALKGIHPLGTNLLRTFIDENLEYNHHVFMSDIEIVAIAYFSDPKGDYQDYFRYIDSTDGFWLYRWGNNAVRTIGVSMFVPESKVYEMRIPYAHQSYCHCKSSTKCVREGNNGTTRWKDEVAVRPWYVCPT